MKNKAEFGPIVGDTTDEYTVLDDFVWIKNSQTKGMIVISETGGTNAAKVKIEGEPLCCGTIFPVELLAETALPEDGQIVYTIDCYCPQIRIKVKSTVAESPAAISACGSAV